MTFVLSGVVSVFCDAGNVVFLASYPGCEEEPALDFPDEDLCPSDCLPRTISTLYACLVEQLFLRLTLRAEMSPLVRVTI